MIKAVLDTSTLISALGWQGKPQQILNYCLEGKFKLITSPEILSEIKEVLFREKFNFIEASKKEEFILLLSQLSEVIIPTTTISICRDKDDNKFIEVAVTSNVDYIISSDDDLLAIKEHCRIKILSVSEFLDILKKIK